MDNLIPVSDPKAQYQRLQQELQQALGRVCSSGHYILGPEVKGFERAFAEYLGVSHCIGVASGTDAVALALRAAGVLAGEEVITVSHSAVATVAAIEQIGAVPVFADIERESRCLDALRIEELVSSRSRAIVPVHIYGQPARMREILEVARKHKLAVIEDCAQAHGAMIGSQRVGSFGDLAAFSFYPTKNLGALGDGGAIATSSGRLAEQARLLHQYGWQERYISSVAGVNSRLDEMQAAILSVKLRYLDHDTQRRRQIAAFYRSCMDGERLVAPAVIEGTTHAMHLFVLECDKRDELRNFLEKRGIGTALHYPLPIHQQPAYQGRIRGAANLSSTERLYRRLLSLPMYPELTDSQVGRVGDGLREWRD
jgi:dTDP-4-amino-4,6-dideoxygalactose transaminase